MMEFYIVDQNLNIVGIIDSYKSAIWTERYYESGDFELYLPATANNILLLQKQRFVVRTDQPTKCMIIEDIQIETDEENGDYMTVSGRSISTVLMRRIIWKQTTYSGYTEQMVYKMLEKNCTAPDDSDRIIPYLTLAPMQGLTEKISRQFTGDHVETAIQDVCKDSKLGYRVNLDLENKQFIFSMYRGEDRSYDQSVNPYVVFSPNYDNLLSSKYQNTDVNFHNVLQVAGEGEGIAKQKVTVGRGSGLNRFESFLNASQTSANSGELDVDTYRTLLYQQGQEKLADLAVQESMDSDVVSNSTYQLNRDYFLGDVVEVVNEFGLAMTPRVTEVIECQDDTGYSIVPKFEVEN